MRFLRNNFLIVWLLVIWPLAHFLHSNFLVILCVLSPMVWAIIYRTNRFKVSV
jgi:hypothetical protein